ncbi:metal-sensitive transcriptional regulator [Pseudenhygromyxa sp. WMMC2535]|nr:metal-sensitive transcriptional regulator [Pseudenhygromyxa sp. WMMC2535]
MMDPQTKGKVEARLKRVAGQVAGVQRMVEDDRYCIDVLLQISAARAALAKVGKILLESHVRTCVKSAFESEDDQKRDAKIAELIQVFDKHY